MAETANLLIGKGTSFGYIAIGSSTDVIGAASVALGNESFRQAAVVSRVQTDVTNDTAQWVTTFAFVATTTITEVGIFNAAAAGHMLAGQTFAVINVASGDSLQIVYKADVD